MVSTCSIAKSHQTINIQNGPLKASYCSLNSRVGFSQHALHNDHELTTTYNFYPGIPFRECLIFWNIKKIIIIIRLLKEARD